jgi:DNA helicase-2/ATP-dependent DNA helicase PcrA
MDISVMENPLDLASQNKFLDSLNKPQRDGVLTTDGPVLVVAGAGSGKTKMLTARIAHLIRGRQVNPSHILAVTFTNKAAGEMRSRVESVLGLPPDTWRPRPFWMEGNRSAGAALYMEQPTIGTFHSVCIRILRREIEHLPFTAQFQVLDDSDQLSMIKDCFGKLNLSDKMFSPKNFQWAINEAKCHAKEPADLEVSDFDVFAKNLAKVYALYQEEMYRSNVIDFGEIITATYKLFRDHPEVLQKYQEQFRYIHVDEYQDTNRAQYLVIHQLAARYRNLCVVGDEDQSIYRWRGADIRNILDFETDYPEARVIKLEQNYRSTQTIINASSHVIANNSKRKNKTLWTANEEGTKIQQVRVADDLRESDFVVKQVQKHCEDDGFGFNDVAIFYRTNAQSRILEDALRRHKLPYTIVGGLKFYDRKEIKDVVAYLKVMANPADSICLKRIINVPARGIGKTTVDKIEELQFSRGITFYDAMDLATKEGVLTGAAAKKVSEFHLVVKKLRDLMPSMGLGDFYHHILDETGYLRELRLEGTEESLARVENLQEFDSIIAEFQQQLKDAGVLTNQDNLKADMQLTSFLEAIALATEVSSSEGGGGETVSLMTLHTSKGLEFPLVFMVGCEEGLFPSIRAHEVEDEEEIEEERRLCYVGMTRAKQILYMTYAVCRRVYGNIMYHEPSRFLTEMPAQFVERHDISGLAARNQGGGYSGDEGQRYVYDDVPAYNTTSAPKSDVYPGRKVRHPVYGPGVIRAVEGATSDMKVSVEFPRQGLKKFIYKFAQLVLE